MEKPNDVIKAQDVRPADFPEDIWAAASFVWERLRLLQGEPSSEKIKLIAVALMSERMQGQGN